MQRIFSILSTVCMLLLATRATQAAVPPVAGYARWFDASTLGVSDGASISTWPDLSGNGANATVPSGNANPTYLANAGTETSLAAIHFTAGSGANSSGAFQFTRDSSIHTVFSVFKGSSFLLTDSSLYQFHRPSDDNPASPLFTGWARDNSGYSEDSGPITYPTTGANTGSTYVNGTLVQPFDDRGAPFAMPTDQHNGYNLVEVLSGNPLQANSFNKDRAYHSGDQSQAEVIIYDRVLTEAERVSVETYLMNKWFGPAGAGKDILSFKFGALGAAIISGTNIYLTVPFGTDLTHLTPSYTLSPLAMAVPASGITNDFTNAVNYTVTAHDGSTKVYRVRVLVSSTGNYRGLGYLYLSPLPGAEYTPAQTQFVLVRFKDVSPSVVTNLSQSIQVIGASSGIHTGTTKIASDNRTVIFQMNNTFQSNELVTVNLAPLTPSNAIEPYQYQFMTSGHMPDPPAVTARGDNPPEFAKENAFDRNSATKWQDSVVPNGSANSSWIQYVYPINVTHYLNQYAITSANDAPECDPMDWRFYGVDSSNALTLLDTRTNQSFSSRLQTRTFALASTVSFSGYRLEITKVANPASAAGVQLAELAFIEPTGSILREYWTGISGTAVSDLTSNANYPNSPSGRDSLSSFEAPTNWADSYGTRVRGYLTAPSTGSYVFWIASDDNSELWLSTNADPANRTRIAYVPGWTNSRQWSTYAEQQSAAINLVAGQTYYIEALQKEGGGGDNLAVAWAKPGQATSAPSEVVPGWVLTPWIVTGNISPQPPMPTPAPPLGNTPASPGKAGIMPNGVSVPSNFPFINITTNNNPYTDPIFIDNRGGGGNPYNVIFDNSGSPIWYQRMPGEQRDMKVQPNGMLTMLTSNGFIGLNNHYELVAHYPPANGYSTNDHELQVLADGTYFLIGDHGETVDLSRYVPGASTSVGINENCIQQFTPQGDLIFQWRAWDHLDPASQNTVVTTTNPGDFTHMNAVAVDSDGHILLSSRNTSEVTKINADTGEIIWRLGGTHNQFTFVNDPLNGQRNQHCIRPLGNNHYTLFDNGDGHSPQVSRGVEYVIDPVAMTATLVWQYPDPATTSIYSFYMGNVQRLPNGNTLINWAVGNLPKLTEVRPDGTKAFEMNWVNQYEGYRVWRCPWHGVALKPYLILEAYPDNVTLIFNQFGDSSVVTYRIYGGSSPQPTSLLATSGTTMKSLSNLTSGQTYYFRVTAVNSNGVEGPYSNEENVAVNIIKPGQNMVANGDFSGGTASWSSSVTSPAAATWSTASGYSSYVITNGGSSTASIQLKQTGLPMVLGNTYVFEFDAWTSSGTRTIEAKVMQNGSSNTNYSSTRIPNLTATKQHYRYIFTMAAATDLSSMMVFNLGGSTKSVFLDNISLFNPPPGDLNMDGKVDLLDLKLMGTDWRKQQSGLTSDLDGNGKVDFSDFGILGDNWSP